MGKLIKLYNENTSEARLREVVEALEGGAVIIYPTDTLYALGCSLSSLKAINRIKDIKRKDSDDLSLICCDLSNISDYARVDNNTFKILKHNTPGAFTFILQASGAVPNKFLERKKTVGIRIPNNNITTSIVRMLGVPLVSTSLPSWGDEVDDSLNAELVWEHYRNDVDIMVDGGDAVHRPSTVVELSAGEIDIIRQGDAILEII